MSAFKGILVLPLGGGQCSDCNFQQPTIRMFVCWKISRKFPGFYFRGKLTTLVMANTVEFHHLGKN